MKRGGGAVLLRERDQLAVPGAFADPQHFARFGVALEHSGHVHTFSEVAQQQEMDAGGDAQAGIGGVHDKIPRRVASSWT